MYQLAINSGGYSDFLIVVLATISSLLAMMSIAFSPWILYATVSSNQYSLFTSSSPSVPSSIHVVSTTTTTGNGIQPSANGQHNKADVDYAIQTDDCYERESMETTSCVERNIQQVLSPENGIYNGEERTSVSPTTATSTAMEGTSSPTPIATSTTKSHIIVTPKRGGLATNVVFRGATLSVEASRNLKRKVSLVITSSEESEDSIIDNYGSSSDRNELQPKKKLKSPTSNNKKPNNHNYFKFKSPASNTKKLLSEHRVRCMEEEKVQRKKKKSATKNWMTMYEQLASFKEQNHGSTVVPWSNRDLDIQQLGYWIRDQKRKLQTNKLSRNHSDLLQSIGIE